MATLAHHQSVSLHATPPVSDTSERPRGSYVSARSLTYEANFSGRSQQWHVIGRNGVTVSVCCVQGTRSIMELSIGTCFYL